MNIQKIFVLTICYFLAKASLFLAIVFPLVWYTVAYVKEARAELAKPKPVYTADQMMEEMENEKSSAQG